MPDVIVEVDSRPVDIEVGSGPETLTQILAAIDAVRGRAALYGVTDPLLAALHTEASVEADFVAGVYRRGYVAGSVPGVLGSWAFTRTGAGRAETAGGGIRSFATGLPRITDRGLLMEAAATNFWLHSEDFFDAAWTKSGATIAANAGMAPDGATTADKLVENSANTQHFVSRATSGTKSMSVYAKAAGRTWLAFQHGSALVYFNLSGAGAVGTSTADRAEIEALGNGWYRCTSVVNTPANDTRVIYLASGNGVVSYLGDGASGVLLWGGQTEASAYKSSSISTTSAAATRGADMASFQTVSGAEGGLFVEADLPSHLPTSGQTLASWSNGLDTHVLVLRNTAGALVAALLKPTGNVSLTVAGLTGARRVKVFAGWAAGRFVFTVNGASVGEIASTAPGPMTSVRPGKPHYDGDAMEGYVRRLLVTTRLPTLAQRNAMTVL